MIRFDANSIYNRLLEKIQQDPNWKAISNNSVISAILNSNAEVGSEIARYAEYLFKESKWDTAQNTSSILAMANVLGYQPKRRVSATGKLTVSIDPKIHMVGRTIPSRILAPHLSQEQKVELGLNKWQKPIGNDFYISPDSIITDERGVKYIAEPNIYKGTDNFISLSIIQGEKSFVAIDIDTIRNTYTSSELDPYIYIPITIENCENAKSSISRPYFKVNIVRKGGNGSEVFEEYRIVDTLLLSSPNDRDVEVYNDFYSQNLFYLKFNKDPSRGNYLNISRTSDILGIRVDYIKTAGAAGNLFNNFTRFTIVNPINRGGIVSPYTKLYGINKEAIVGGQDEENIVDIKRNAPKFYIRNYTIGTKEAYENAILNLTIPAGGQVLVPSTVTVYGSQDSNKSPITCVSFIAPGLDDLILNRNWAEENGIKDGIDASLNTLLSSLKSPQDQLQFVAPEYISIATAINVKISRDNAKDLSVLTKEVQDYINSIWGPNSPELNFNRSFSTAGLNSALSVKFKDIKGFESSITLEAIKKLEWKNATYVETNTTSPTQSELPAVQKKVRTTISAAAEGAHGDNYKISLGEVDFVEKATKVHTIRIPFSFGKEFLGSKEEGIGFGDYSTSHQNLVRIDLMYKKPLGLKEDGNTSFNTSIFMNDDISRFYSSETLPLDPPINKIYCIKDTGDIWNPKFEKEGNYFQLYKGDDENHPEVITSELCFQCPMSSANKVLTNEEYITLRDNPPLEKTHSDRLGTIDNYIIYFESNYNNPEDEIVSGWFECDFDSLYAILTKFALYDSVLRKELQKIQLSNLKCGQDNDVSFNEFIEILNSYVDIYVSLQPKSNRISLSDYNKDKGDHKVIYIDSWDSTSVNTSIYGSQLSNLSPQKLTRMLNVKCDKM